MRGPRGKRTPVKLDADGVPVDGRDWTEADWADLHYGLVAIKARIAARHTPKASEMGSEARESTAKSGEPKSWVPSSS